MDCKPSIFDLQRSILGLSGNIYIISSDQFMDTIANQIRKSLDSHLSFPGSLFRNDLRSLNDIYLRSPTSLYPGNIKSEGISISNPTDRRKELIDLTQVPEIPASPQPKHKTRPKPKMRPDISVHGIMLFAVENYEQITDYKKRHCLSRQAARLQLWSALGRDERKAYSDRTRELNANKKAHN